MSFNLLSPIPDQTEAREAKVGYRDHPIAFEHPLNSEPLVPLANYGIEGFSYYSQPNKTTGDAVLGVSPDIYLRQSLAEKLAAVDEFLAADDETARLLDGRPKLHVRDGFRSPDLQAHLYHIVLPNLLAELFPDWTEEQVVERRNRTLATPDLSLTSIPPHATGGAVDLGLQYSESGETVFSGYGRAELGRDAIYPDFLEGMTEDEALVRGLSKAVLHSSRVARRTLYNLMTSEEIGGLATVVNPSETWHFSFGDQLWAQLVGAEVAYYGYPDELPAALDIDTVLAASETL